MLEKRAFWRRNEEEKGIKNCDLVLALNKVRNYLYNIVLSISFFVFIYFHKRQSSK